ncbi:guanylate kinase [Desulfothermus okinawensis JCM 13304]
MKNRGIALIISGPSGAGKGTLTKMLMEEFPDIQFSISYTTRKPRPGEIDGKDYVFVSKEEFEKLIKEDMFAEWANVHGNYYGTPKREIEEKLNRGFDVVFDIDVQGARNLRQNLTEGVFVFILPPSIEELKQRLKKRGGDDPDTIDTRIRNAKKEMETSQEFDYAVLNDDLSRAYEMIRCIYLSSKCKVRK